MFSIGKLKFAHPYVQGPLAGYSNAAFRSLLWESGDIAYSCSEMLPANCVITELHDHKNRFTWRHPQEKVLCYQISGHEEDKLVRAGKVLEDLGADIIDLNAGCPKKKIRKKGCGSAMLDDLANLQKCIRSLSKNLTCPLTVKIRIPNPKCLMTTTEYVKSIAEAGASAITIHARHFLGDHQEIMLEHWFAGVAAEACPIIINGDIKSTQEADKLLAVTKANACMIARAGFIAPWLYSNVDVNNQIKFNYINKHLWGLTQFMSEELVCLQARTILHYYSKTMTDFEAKSIKALALERNQLKALLQGIEQVLIT